MQLLLHGCEWAIYYAIRWMCAWWYLIQTRSYLVLSCNQRKQQCFTSIAFLFRCRFLHISSRAIYFLIGLIKSVINLSTILYLYFVNNYCNNKIHLLVHTAVWYKYSISEVENLSHIALNWLEINQFFKYLPYFSRSFYKCFFKKKKSELTLDSKPKKYLV